MSRCQNDTLINSCEECVALQDPSCVWDLTKQKCISRDDLNLKRNINNFIKNYISNDIEKIYTSSSKNKLFYAKLVKF